MTYSLLLRASPTLAILAMPLQLCSAELEFVESIALATRLNVYSEILEEDRSVLVYLPETYNSEGDREQRYPGSTCWTALLTSKRRSA